MIIPKKFRLAGRVIRVRYDERLAHRDSMSGCAEYRYDRILLQPSTKSQPRTPSSIGDTFCHELVHWILHMIGEDELNDNERFVKSFSGLLHQYLITKKGKK